MAKQFMQIFGNCNDIFYLGDCRVRGPVDNVITKNPKIVEYLLNGSYFDYLKTSKFSEIPRDWGLVDTEPNVMFDFDDVLIVHNDIREEKFWTNLELRCKAFEQFLQQVQTDKDSYFVVSLSKYLINQAWMAPRNELFDLITILKTNNILHKTIFVQFDHPLENSDGARIKWNCKLWTWSPLVAEHKKDIKWVTVKYGAYNKAITEKLYARFIADVDNLIKE